MWGWGKSGGRIWVRERGDVGEKRVGEGGGG